MISTKNTDGSKNLFGSQLGVSSLALPGQTPSNNFKNMATAWKSNYSLPGQVYDETYDDESDQKSTFFYEEDKDLDSYF